MGKKRWTIAVEIGLRLSHSKKSLDYIRLVDLELYDAIMNSSNIVGK